MSGAEQVHPAARAAIAEGGLVPVIRSSAPETALRIADALMEAGVRVLEITLTVPGALAVIETLAARLGDAVVVGAGTITSVGEADAAADAGAEFIVTPCLLPQIIDASRAAGRLVIPGALTPTEVFAAVQRGADLIKIFPAQCVGGPAYLNALSGPFPKLALVPTGGITLANAGDYIKAGAIAVGVGGELVPREAVARGDFGAITALARRFLAAIANAR